MPDNWEYPWFAAWDLAFHAVTLAVIDPAFAKNQLLLLTREWYMHANGQLPAYEWRFGDVNPPVHAWAAWRVYQIERRMNGTGDLDFLERVFHKLLLNFTWWVNRKDLDGANVFQGGFLGLDNIGLFDRDAPLPGGSPAGPGRRHGLDGDVLPEHAGDRPGAGPGRPGLRGHRDQVLRALPVHRRCPQQPGRDGISLWDEADGFYYDVAPLRHGQGRPAPGPIAGRADPAPGGPRPRAEASSAGCPTSGAG